LSDPEFLCALRGTTVGFAAAPASIARLARPTVPIQEGGYLSASLGASLTALQNVAGWDT